MPTDPESTQRSMITPIGGFALVGLYKCRTFVWSAKENGRFLDVMRSLFFRRQVIWSPKISLCQCLCCWDFRQLINLDHESKCHPYCCVIGWRLKTFLLALEPMANWFRIYCLGFFQPCRGEFWSPERAHPLVRNSVHHSEILVGVDTDRICGDLDTSASPWLLTLRFRSKFAYVGPHRLSCCQTRCFVDVVTKWCHIDQVKQVMNLRQNQTLAPFQMVELQCWHRFLSSN